MSAGRGAIPPLQEALGVKTKVAFLLGLSTQAILGALQCTPPLKRQDFNTRVHHTKLYLGRARTATSLQPQCSVQSTHTAVHA